MSVGTKAHILLVEDDDTARLSLTRVINRVGYSVEAVPDGEQASALLAHPVQRERYDVVLTDLLLREIDGLQVLKTARLIPDPPEVILLTGYGTLQTAIEALRAGAMDYLLKPCKPEELLRCIDTAVKRRMERRAHAATVRSITNNLARLQGEPVSWLLGESDQDASFGRMDVEITRSIHIGGLSIDRVRRIVSFEGTTLALTPTEYALLSCLANAGGQVVTYGEIVHQVYHLTVDGDAAHQLLKTHIHNLRHKLNPAYIVNVRGTGFRLVAPDMP